VNVPQESTVNTKFLTLIRRLGLIEGTSTLVLFGIAMPLKYLAGIPMAVRVVGSLHGFLFVALALLLLLAVSKVPISRKAAWLGVLAAIVPFGPFVYDRWLMRQFPPTADDLSDPPLEESA